MVGNVKFVYVMIIFLYLFLVSINLDDNPFQFMFFTLQTIFHPILITFFLFYYHG